MNSKVYKELGFRELNQLYEAWFSQNGVDSDAIIDWAGESRSDLPMIETNDVYEAWLLEHGYNIDEVIREAQENIICPIDGGVCAYQRQCEIVYLPATFEEPGEYFCRKPYRPNF